MPAPKASDKRVMINGRYRVVHLGSHGGEYILQKGVFVSVKSVVAKSAKTAAKAKKVVKRGEKTGQRGGG